MGSEIDEKAREAPFFLAGMDSGADHQGSARFPGLSYSIGNEHPSIPINKFETTLPLTLQPRTTDKHAAPLTPSFV